MSQGLGVLVLTVPIDEDPGGVVIHNLFTTKSGSISDPLFV